MKQLGIFFLALLAGPFISAIGGLAGSQQDWRTASRESTGIAPDPRQERGPVVQVYGARTFGWRGALAVHTWISVKRRNARQFTTYEVIGWRYWHGGNALSVREGPPDRKWFGSDPEIYVDLRGDHVEAIIDRIETAVAAYPHARSYRTWPGPNSNTFTAAIGRAVPELELDLPPTAIGKDYLGLDSFAARSPSGTGFQISLFGMLGLLLAKEEGLEINVLGLTLGVDPLGPALKIPGLGRVGFGS